MFQRYVRKRGKRPMGDFYDNANAVMERRRKGEEAGTITVFDNDPEATAMDKAGLTRATSEELKTAGV